MEMCYDGAMVLPSNYAVMDEEEMTYLEGGYNLAKTVYGIGIRLTGKETNYILGGDYQILAAPIAALLGVAFGTASLIVSAAIAPYYFLIKRWNSNNSGVTFVIGSSIPIVFDNDKTSNFTKIYW